jgi:hypothetical protein
MKTILAVIALFQNLIMNISFDTESRITIKEVMGEEVNCPGFAIKSLMEGVIFVTFKIDENGKVSVQFINSFNEKLRKYVVDKLRNSKIIPISNFKGKTYIMKLTFELNE